MKIGIELNENRNLQEVGIMDANGDMKQVLDELEKMRDEYAGLKEELDRQKIINGKLMENTFRKNIDVLDSNKKTGIAVCVVMTLFLAALATFMEAFTLPVAAGVALCLIIMAGYIVLYRRMDFKDGIDDVRTTALKVRKFRKDYIKFQLTSYAWVLGFIIISAPFIFKGFLATAKGLAAIALIIVIFIACACAQYLTDKKVLKACDEIIDRLEEGEE